MTYTEAIEILENGDWWDGFSENIPFDAAMKLHKALDIAISLMKEKSDLSDAQRKSRLKKMKEVQQ